MRPNQDRRKTTVYLAEANRVDVAEIRRRTGCTTDAQAVRHALRFTADYFRRPTATRDCLAKLVAYVRGLVCLSERERSAGASLLCQADVLTSTLSPATSPAAGGSLALTEPRDA